VTLHAIAVPKWGLAMEEGTLTGWLVNEGAAVKPGDEIAEIETSKIANVLEAPGSGILRRRIASEGDVKPVGALLGVLADAGEDEAAIDEFVAEYERHFATAAESAPKAPTAETIQVAGKPIRFLKVPARAETPGTPLVLLHGFGGDHLNWAFNQGALAADRDVYALDLPGHGGSTKDVGTGDLATLAGTIGAWLDATSLERVHVVGHSMGGAVALTFALAQPGRVASLVTLCGGGLGGTLDQTYVEGFVAAGKRKELQPVVERLFANPALVTREMLEDLIAAKRIDGAGEALRTLIDHALAEDALAALAARLDAVTPPLLPIFGAEDRIIALPVTLPAGSHVIAGVGHMPHLEAAEEVNRRIAAFIAGLD
jgi:pyruvate dehydrogenase E2 component (dihydrolipoamide acetyltransferase)